MQQFRKPFYMDGFAKQNTKYMKLFDKLQGLENPDIEAKQYLFGSQLNILYINPEATGANFYKLFVPCELLARTDVVCTAMGGWQKYNPVKRFRSEDQKPLDSWKIRWADIIVIPFTNQDMSQFMQFAKAIKESMGGQQLRIVFHLDFDFTSIPKNHPLKDAFGEKEIDNIYKNIFFADKVVVTNGALASHVISTIRETGQEVDREKFGVQTLSYDPMLFLDRSELTQKERDSDYFNLVVLAGDNQLDDINAVIPLLLEAKKKYGKVLKIIFFGVNKNKEQFSKMVKGLEYIPHGAVPIWKYYSTLSELNPDLVLIPSDLSEYSTRSNDYKRFIDCGILGIPVITANVNPYDKIITHGENGFVYDTPESFDESLAILMSNRDASKEVGQQAKEFCEDNFEFNQQKLQKLLELMA